MILLFVFVLCGISFSQKYEIKSINIDGKEFRIKENSVTKAPHRVYGIRNKYSIENIRIGDNDLKVFNFSRKLFNDLEKVTKFSLDDLELIKTNRTSEYLTATFEQKYKGLRVLNSEIGYTINRNGAVVSFGADYYYDINISNNPALNENEAMSIIKNIRGEGNKLSITKNPELVIFPKISDNSADYFLIWNIEVYDSIKYERLAYYINAQNGEIVDKILLTRNGGYFGGTLKYKYYPLHHTDTPEIANCSNMKVQVYNGIGQKCDEVYTNSSGYYGTVNYLAYSTYFVYLAIKSDFVEVRDRNILAIEYIYNFNNTSPTNLVTTAVPYSPRATYNKTWDACDATNLYYHVNYAHGYFKNSFTYNAMDYSMIATFDAGQYTNGSADGTNINFGYQDGKFWARAADVIYHEYTHNVIHHIYNGFIESGSSTTSQAIAMDEGLADFFACNMTNDAIMGESVDINRNLNNSYSWNPANDKYYNGQVIGGACWDIRNSLGQGTTQQIVFKALQLVPKARNFQDFLENLLLADVLLYNGSNRNTILSSFNNHNIQPEIMTVNMTGPASLLPNQSGTWNVSASGGVPPYTYAWSYYKPCISGGVGAAPCGSWFDMYNSSNSLSRYDTQDFELKCLVTDAVNQTSATSLYVTVSSIQPSYHENSTQELHSYETETPTSFVLYQNYPNPFNPTTTIKFSLPTSDYVSINIYNTIGQLVETLANKNFQSGYHTLDFNASNLPSGIYFYRIQTGNEVITKQMTLVK